MTYKKKNQELNYKFVDRALFFPEKKILVIGDLHIGYEHQLIKSGILTPKTQIKTLINDLERLIKKTNPEKLIFLGDIKHAFSYEAEEKFRFKDVYDFLRTKIKEKNIIFIKGNHDTIDYSFKNKLKDYYLTKDNEIAFVHGHKPFPEIYSKNVKILVLGHLHPSVIFSDKDTSKKERYKCFLVGKHKKKKFIALPSFLGLSIGKSVNSYNEEGYRDYFSILSKKSILKSEVYVVGKDKVYNFGKVRDLD